MRRDSRARPAMTSLRARPCRPRRPMKRSGRLEQTLSGWRSEYALHALGIGSFGPLELDPHSRNLDGSRARPSRAGRERTCSEPLERAAGVPAAFDTDVNAAALAEMRWGAGQGLDDFAYITVGTGSASG